VGSKTVDSLSLKLEVTDSGAVRILRETGKEIESVAGKAGKASGSFGRFGASVVTLNQGLELVSKFARPAIAYLAGAVREGARLETTFAKAAAEIRGNAAPAIGALREEVLQLLKTVPKDADDLGAGALKIVAGGFEDAGAAIKILGASTKLATAGFITVEVAADTVAGTLTRFNRTADDAEQVANALFIAARKGALEIGQLGTQIGAASFNVKRLGLDFEDLAAGYAALTQQGLSATDAQSGLTRVISAFNRPGKEMLALLDAAGFKTGRAAIEQLGLAGALVRVTEEAGKNTAVLQRAVGGPKALAVALATASDEGRLWIETAHDMRDGTEQLEDGFTKASATVESQTQLLENAKRRVEELAFDALAPGITEVMRALADGLNDATDDLGSFTTTLVDTLIPAMAALITAAGQVGPALRAAFNFKPSDVPKAYFNAWFAFFDSMMTKANDAMPDWIRDEKFAERVAAGTPMFETVWDEYTADVAAARDATDEVVARLYAAGEAAKTAAVQNDLLTRSFLEGTSDQNGTSEEGGGIEHLARRLEFFREKGIALSATNRRLAEEFGLIAAEATKARPVIDGLGEGIGDLGDDTDKLSKALSAAAAPFEFAVDGAKAQAEAAKAVVEQLQDQIGTTDALAGSQKKVQDAIATSVAADHLLIVAERGVLEAKLRVIEATGAQGAAELAQADSLRKQIAALGTLETTIDTAEARYAKFAKTVKSENEKVAGSIETVGEALSRTFSQIIEDTFTGIVQGTRKLKDIVGGVRDAVVAGFARMFSDVISEKIKKLDTPFEENVGGIGGLFTALSSRILTTFGATFRGLVGGFKSLASLFKTFKGIGGIFGGKEAGAAGAGAPAAGGEAAGAAGGAEGAAGATGGAATAGYAAFAAAVLIVFAAILASIIKAFSPKLADDVKKDVRDGLTKLLVKTLGIITPEELRALGREKVVSKEVPTLGDRLDEGKPVSDRARVLALLASSGDTPFGGPGNRRLFSIFGGQLQSILEDFPDKQDKVSTAVAGAFSEGLGDAITKMQAQFLRIVDEIRGADIRTGRKFQPTRTTDFEDLTPEQKRKVRAVEGETEKEALRRLIKEGFLLPLEDAVEEMVNIFSTEMPQAVKNSIPKIVDDAFVESQKKALAREVEAIFADLKDGGATGSDEQLRRRAERLAPAALRKRGDILTVDGDQIQRSLEIELEAFGSLAAAILAGTQEIVSGKPTKQALEALGASLTKAVAERAQKTLSEAFLKVTDFENLLGPLFRNLEVGVEGVLKKFAEGTLTAGEATSAIDEIVATMGTDFEALARRAEEMGPLLEQFAELQRRIQLAVTSFAQAAQAAGKALDAIDLLIADLTGDGIQARLELAVKAATDAQATAIANAEKTLGPAFAALFKIVGRRALTEPGFDLEDVGLKAFRKSIKKLSDDDLKGLVDQLQAVAEATAAKANAEIAVLESQLQLVEEWASLTDSARDALDQVQFAGLDSFDKGPKEFAATERRFLEALDDFRTGTDAERLAGAQALIQLGPALLELAEQAGIGPGSPEFELLRGSVVNALSDVAREAAAKEAERDAIQERIRDVQEAAAEQLRLLREFMVGAQAELQRRSLKAAEKTADKAGSLDDLKPIGDTMTKVLQRLDQGINIFEVGHDGAQKDPFTAIGLASGGIVTRGFQPAILHGPEAVIPLARLPGIIRSAVGIDEIRRARTDDGDVGAILTRLEAALGRRSVSASIQPVIEYHEAESRDARDDGKGRRRGGDAIEEMEKVRELRRLLRLAMLDASLKADLRRMLGGL